MDQHSITFLSYSLLYFSLYKLQKIEDYNLFKNAMIQRLL